jgi:citrate lyase subunit beta / citryl-CoA lyase
MSPSVRPRRSLLYMPGSNARALEKAKTLPADGLILDLEDAVAPDAKAVGREQVCGAVKGGGYGGRELVIRVNGLDTPWGKDDIAAAAAAKPDAVLVPKVESAAQVQAVDALLQMGGAPAGTTIWCMMETPLGILHAEAIAGASERVACLVLGTSDLTKDLHARHTAARLPMLTSLSLCLLAGRAFGLTVLDGVHLDLADEAGFVAACRQGLELGFDGKTLIHPKQVEPCNAVFAPSPEEVADARKIITAFQAATAAGKGVVLVDGKLIENLHVEAATRLVTLADAIERLQAAA